LCADRAASEIVSVALGVSVEPASCVGDEDDDDGGLVAALAVEAADAIDTMPIAIFLTSC